MYEIGDYILVSRIKSVENFIVSNSFNLPQVILLLLLKGTFIIKKCSVSKAVSQKTDYTILGLSKYNHDTTRDFLNYINSIDNPNFLYKNINFYKPILIEFIACLFSHMKGHGIVAFLHLYRILERISYALPLLYAKNSSDYKGTYEYFKSFFKSKEQKLGELKFFKVSLLSILDDTEKRFCFTYELDALEKKALSICLKNINIKENNNLDDDEYISFDLSIIDSIELLINIRNSFFHALSGEDHITLESFIFPDQTFIKLSPNFINALGFIIAKTIEHIIYQKDIEFPLN